MLNKEYEKSFQEKDVSVIFCCTKMFRRKSLQGVTAEDLDLSDTFIASLFEEASKDQEVLDRKDWIDRNYPQSTFTDPTPNINNNASIGRFQVVPILRSSFNRAVRDIIR